jgi:hypothetical protein
MKKYVDTNREREGGRKLHRETENILLRGRERETQIERDEDANI